MCSGAHASIDYGPLRLIVPGLGPPGDEAAGGEVALLFEDRDHREGVGHVLVDAEGRIVFYNDAAAQLVGEPFEEIGTMTRDEWNARYGPVDGQGDALAADELPLAVAVREGRPAIPILENRISFQNAIVDNAAATIVQRLKETAPTIERVIPLVGRVDVDNFPTALSYVGTAWLVGGTPGGDQQTQVTGELAVPRAQPSAMAAHVRIPAGGPDRGPVPLRSWRPARAPGSRR